MVEINMAEKLRCWTMNAIGRGRLTLETAPVPVLGEISVAIARGSPIV